MDGIAGGLTIKEKGTVRYEIIDDDGEVQEILVEAFHIPKLGCRLFSPQAYFRQLQNEGIDPDGKSQMVVTYDKAKLTLANNSTISLYYDPVTHLPRMKAFKCALSSATALAMNGCVTDETNQNLSPQQKILLKWHFRLGHLGFATLQWLGRSGMLGPFGEKMGAARLLAPKCAACLWKTRKNTDSNTSQ